MIFRTGLYFQILRMIVSEPKCLTCLFPLEYTDDPGGEIMCRPAENNTKDCKLELKMKTVDEFFNHFFFPASDYYQLVTRNIMEEKHHPESQIALDKMKQKPNNAVRTTCS